MYKELDIYNKVFKLYKEFITEKDMFGTSIYKKAPQNLSKFPTIVFKEVDNFNSNFGKTINNEEFIDELMYSVDIYTKDKIIDGNQYSSEAVMRDLQYLTFEFFYKMKFNRESCKPTEYLDITVDRKTIIFSCTQNSWNGKIN